MYNVLYVEAQCDVYGYLVGSPDTVTHVISSDKLSALSPHLASPGSPRFIFLSS